VISRPNPSEPREEVAARDGSGFDRRPPEGRSGPPAWVVAILGFAVGAALVLRLVTLEDMDPTIFLAFGEEKPAQIAYGRDRLGDIAIRQGAGHDGKYFFIQANDPWFLEPQENAAVLDAPFYRGVRMLYPTLAGGAGLFPPTVIVWSFLVVNLIVLGIGTAVAARLASLWGSTSWLGLAVPLNIGLVYELLIDGSAILAYTCCLGAVYAMTRNRTALAAGLFAAAALSREVFLIFSVGVFVLWWVERRKLPWSIVIAPVVGMAVWAGYLTWRLSGITGTGTELGSLSPPFFGLARAFGTWLQAPEQLIVNALILMVIIAFVPLALRSRLPLAWGALPFVVLMPFLWVDVFLETADLSRAVAPVFTACAFLVVLRREQEPATSTEAVR
jgi:hypothetical protein